MNVQIILREWERVVFALASLTFLATVAWSTVQLTALFSQPLKRTASNDAEEPTFSANAFAFLQEADSPVIPSSNAFNTPYAQIQRQRNTRPVSPPARDTNETVVSHLPPPTKPAETETKQPAPKPPKVPDRVPPAAPPTKLPPRPTPPPEPQLREYVEYKGVMTAPSGQEFAFINLIKELDHNRTVTPMYLQTGRPVRGYTIESYDGRAILLLPQNGSPRRLRMGQKLELSP